MFYVSRGNVPHKRHTQHRSPSGELYAEELFGMEGFTGRSSLLYHLVPPTQTHDIERCPRPAHRAIDDGIPPPSPRQDRRHPGRRQHRRRPRAAVLQQRRADWRCTAQLRTCPRTSSTATARADEMLFVHEGDGHLREQLRAAAIRPGRLHRHPHRHHLAPGPELGVGPPPAVPRIADGDRAAQALPQRLGPAAGTRAFLAARHPRSRGRRRPHREPAIS